MCIIDTRRINPILKIKDKGDQVIFIVTDDGDIEVKVRDEKETEDGKETEETEETKRLLKEKE